MDFTGTRKWVLSNGIRVVFENVPSANTVSLGVWVNVGSRDELNDERGCCHFLEHMLFKGTTQRRARQIACEIDALGGEFNAFTTRETTAYYIRVLTESLEKGIELLADMFLHSTLDQEEIAKEKQVVINEIKMSEDDPEELVDDLLNDKVWGGQPLGRSILGSRSEVEGICRERLACFLKKHYVTGNMVIAVSGRCNQEKLLILLEQYFADTVAGKENIRCLKTPHLWNSGRVDIHKELEQTQIAFAVKGLATGSSKRFSMGGLNAILGGSVGSRLFQEVREELGLAYSIYSETVSYQDDGQLNIFAVVNSSEVERVIQIITNEMARLKTGGITTSELKNAKSLLKSDFVFGQESITRRMGIMASDEIDHHKSFSASYMLNAIETITISDIYQLASEIFNEKHYTLAVLGSCGIPR